MIPTEQKAYTLRAAGKTQYAIAAALDVSQRLVSAWLHPPPGASETTRRAAAEASLQYEQVRRLARRPYHREASRRRKQSRAPILAAARAVHAARRSVAQQMHEAGWTNTQIARHFRVSLAAVCRWLARPGLMAATGPLPPLPAPCPSAAAVMAREALPARNAQVCKFWEEEWLQKDIAARLGISTATVCLVIRAAIQAGQTRPRVRPFARQSPRAGGA